MFQQQNDHHRRPLTPRLAIATTAVLTALLLGTGPGTAAARPDAGPAIVTDGQDDGCSLARVGTQYVRCDDNTGNGVPAPRGSPSGEPTRHHHGGPEPERVRGRSYADQKRLPGQVSSRRRGAPRLSRSLVKWNHTPPLADWRHRVGRGARPGEVARASTGDARSTHPGGGHADLALSVALGRAISTSRCDARVQPRQAGGAPQNQRGWCRRVVRW